MSPGAVPLLVLGALFWFIAPPPWTQAAPADAGIAASPQQSHPQSVPEPLDLGKNTFYVQMYPLGNAATETIPACFTD